MGAIMVIIDGMTDSALSPDILPSLQWIRKYGAHGLINNDVTGKSSDSLNCICTLLGVEANCLPTGRAYLESVGQEIVSENIWFFRGNLVTVEAGKLTASYGVGLSAEEERQMQLCIKQHLPKEMGFWLLTQGRSIISTDVFEQLPVTFAPHQVIGQAIEDILPKDALLRKIVEGSRFWLKNFAKEEKAYLFLPWDGAKKEELPIFNSLHKKNAAMIAKTPIVRGIAKEMKVACPQLLKATGDVNTDLQEKLERTIELAKHYDVVVLHINGADEAAHRQDCAAKIRFLQRVDEMILQPLLKIPNRVMICADHGTCCRSGRHFGGWQPFYLAHCEEKGDIGHIRGLDAIKVLTKGS